MTNEELVYRYQQGDKDTLGELVKQNTGIVNQIVNKCYTHKTNSIDKDDLEQEGYIGLMIAANKYNPNKKNSAQFITYAVFWIRQRISRYIYQRNTNEETSLNILAGYKEDTELIDMIKDPIEPYLMLEERLYILELRKELENVMNKYTSLKEREIIKLKYGWDGNREITDSEVGEILKLSKYQVNDIRKRALQKMLNSPWGQEKAKELYKGKEWESIQTVEKLIHRMEFANRYLIKEVDL